MEVYNSLYFLYKHISYKTISKDLTLKTAIIIIEDKKWRSG